MSEPRSIYLDRGGVRLHALDHGTGDKPVLLFLHGAAAHAHWWDWLAGHFADRFRPVAVDLRGHGDSAWAEDYSHDAFTADLAAWLDWAEQQTLTPPAVIAHSLGGVVALKLHEQMRPALQALIVVDAPLRVDDRILDEVRVFGHRESLPWASRNLFVEKFRLVPTARNADPEMIAHAARHSVRSLDDGTWLLKTDRSFHRNRECADLRPGWNRVTAPAMLLVGELSDRLRPEDMAWIRKNLAHVRVEVIPGSHHHVHLDNPEGFIRAARDFLVHALF